MLAVVRRVAELDRNRLMWWLAAAGVTAIGMAVQTRLVRGAEVSVPAWLLVVTVWFPFAFRLRNRKWTAYLLMLKHVTNVAAVLAVTAMAMIATQLAGIAYRDWFAILMPADLQLAGFNTVVPIAYGSPIVRATSWIGLEPSVTSALIGLGLLAAFFGRAQMWKVLVLILGLVATVSGSGVVIVLVGAIVMLFHRCRRLLLRYSVLGIVTVFASTFTPFGALLLGRSTEFQTDNSSTSLRAVLPYSLLYPKWIENLPGMLFGYGPGSSQRIVTESNVLGLLVPSPAKVFFEYGLIAGMTLAAFILGCYWGGPSRAFAISLLFSLWVLQAGITTSVFVVPVMVFVTLWAPRVGPPIEKILPLGKSRTAAPLRDTERDLIAV
ncbi:hypothetical protein ACVBEQ_11380 [Nakamurella sp. GG22]